MLPPSGPLTSGPLTWSSALLTWPRFAECLEEETRVSRDPHPPDNRVTTTLRLWWSQKDDLPKSPIFLQFLAMILSWCQVHVCLYFLSPTGHGLRSIDLMAIRSLHQKVVINLLHSLVES